MYNCYYHPKMQGASGCKGCKLPICGPCQSDTGFCPECTKTREAVRQLRQLRGAVADRSKAGSTTARLRMAIRQVGPGKSPAPARSNAMTRPLREDEAAALLQQMPRPATPRPVAPPAPNVAMAPPANRPAAQPGARKPAKRRSTANFTYDRSKIAYQAPAALREMVENRRPTLSKPIEIQGLPSMAHFGSLYRILGAVSAVVLFAVIVGYPLSHWMLKSPAAHLASKPLYTPLTRQEKAFVKETLANAAPAHPVVHVHQVAAVAAATPVVHHAAPAAPVQPAAVHPAPAAPVHLAAAAPQPAPIQRPAYHPVAQHHFTHAYSAAPTVAYQPRAYAPHTSYYPSHAHHYAYYAPTYQTRRVQRHRPSLADSMHFSANSSVVGMFGAGTGRAHYSSGNAAETIHW